MCFSPARRPKTAHSAGEIGAQPLLVDLPITVLSPVQQNHRQTVAVFGTKFGIPCGRFVHIDAGDPQTELFTELFELRSRRPARTASGADQKRDVVVECGRVRGAGTIIGHASTVRHGLSR